MCWEPHWFSIDSFQLKRITISYAHFPSHFQVVVHDVFHCSVRNWVKWWKYESYFFKKMMSACLSMVHDVSFLVKFLMHLEASCIGWVCLDFLTSMLNKTCMWVPPEILDWSAGKEVVRIFNPWDIVNNASNCVKRGFPDTGGSTRHKWFYSVPALCSNIFLILNFKVSVWSAWESEVWPSYVWRLVLQGTGEVFVAGIKSSTLVTLILECKLLQKKSD